MQPKDITPKALYVLGFALMCGCLSAPSFSQERIYEAPAGRPGVLIPGITLGTDSWLLGTWIDGVFTEDCSAPLLKIFMMGRIDSRPDWQFVARIQGSLGVGATSVKRFVFSGKNKAEVYLWWEPGYPHNAPVGDPIKFERLDDETVLFTHVNGAHLLLRRCPEQPASTDPGDRNRRAGPRSVPAE
jgi:hypothetical protein